MAMEDYSQQDQDHHNADPIQNSNEESEHNNHNESSDEEDGAQTQGTSWVTFDDSDSFGEFEYAPLAADQAYSEFENDNDNEEEEHTIPPAEEKPDYTTSGFLKNKFSQEHVNLIKDCMKNIKLAYVPEWAKISNLDVQRASIQKALGPLPEK